MAFRVRVVTASPSSLTTAALTLLWITPSGSHPTSERRSALASGRAFPPLIPLRSATTLPATYPSARPAFAGAERPAVY